MNLLSNRRSVSGSDFVHVVSKTVDMKHWGKLGITIEGEKWI